MKKIFVIGIGPGENDMMTLKAQKALEESQVIIGYPVYLELVKKYCEGKEVLSTPMKREVDRCRMCFEQALEGKTTSIVCSGDAGIYGMASLIYELSEEYEPCEIEIVPGITAASSGAAVLGSPLNHDFCVISLSDLMTPWELIEKRLEAAAEGDFAIAIYNPSSHKRHDYLKRACEILLRKADPETACGYVKNIGRDETVVKTCTLKELSEMQNSGIAHAGERVRTASAGSSHTAHEVDERARQVTHENKERARQVTHENKERARQVTHEIDMFTTVFIGNSRTRIINGKLVTPRGYLDR